MAVHPVLQALRRLCARLPEGQEQETWEHPTFRVRGKIFATFGPAPEGAVMSVKQTKPDQAALVRDPRFAVAPYVGRHGWVQARVDEVPWPLLEDLVLRSYRLVAPKALVRTLDGS